MQGDPCPHAMTRLPVHRDGSRPLDRPARLLGMAAAVGCWAWVALASAGPSPNGARLLQLREPIEAADARLRRQGWQPELEPPAESFDRELSGNELGSLRACSGTGLGYCRYDYRRGSNRLQVITVPDSNGDGQVVRWTLGAAGGPWGLCQSAPTAPLQACP
jgi:hypothetical protein